MPLYKAPTYLPGRSSTMQTFPCPSAASAGVLEVDVVSRRKPVTVIVYDGHRKTGSEEIFHSADFSGGRP